MIRRWFWIGIVALLGGSVANAQSEEDETTYNYWFDLKLSSELSKKTLVYSDFRYRHVRAETPWQQAMVRPSVIYRLNNTFDVRGGVGAFYSIYQDDDNVLEIRPWVGTMIRWPRFKNNTLTHLIRFEQRSVYDEGTTEWSGSQRLRYRVGTRVKITKFKIIDHFYIPFYAEFFLDNKTESDRIEQQFVRAYIGAGYVFNYRWTLEFQTIFQRTKLFGGDVNTDDIIFRFIAKYYIFPLGIDIDQH